MSTEQSSAVKMGSLGWFRKFNCWQTFKLAYRRWTKADGNEGAAAFAYYLLLSFLPLVILLVAAGWLFVERQEATQAVVQWIKQFVPLTGEQEHSAVESIGGIVAFLMWIYLSSCICFFAICFCAGQAELRERANDPTGTSQ